MKRLLDTNAYVALKKGDPRVEHLVRACEHLYFSIIVLGELYFGFHDGSRLRQSVAELDEFLSHPCFTSRSYPGQQQTDSVGLLLILNAPGRQYPPTTSGSLPKPSEAP